VTDWKSYHFERSTVHEIKQGFGFKKPANSTIVDSTPQLLHIQHALKD